MTLERINKVIAKRDALHVKWREQIAALDDERNVTAGKIYNLDKAIRDAISQHIEDEARDEYAASWIERWPL